LSSYRKVGRKKHLSRAAYQGVFEETFDYWPGFVDAVVARYLDCGVEDNSLDS